MPHGIEALRHSWACGGGSWGEGQLGRKEEGRKTGHWAWGAGRAQPPLSLQVRSQPHLWGAQLQGPAGQVGRAPDWVQGVRECCAPAWSANASLLSCYTGTERTLGVGNLAFCQLWLPWSLQTLSLPVNLMCSQAEWIPLLGVQRPWGKGVGSALSLGDLPRSVTRGALSDGESCTNAVGQHGFSGGMDR